MRHYEILANGCIPYFVDLGLVDEDTMHFPPRDLISEAMNLDGVNYGSIDHESFNVERYYEILRKLLDHTRLYLTSEEMAEYILEESIYTGLGSILFLSGNANEDYLSALTLIGLKELRGEGVIDQPKIEYVYKSYPNDIKKLYGKGISYSKIIDDIYIDRNRIEERIMNREFELIIYASVHRGTPYLNLVKKCYPANRIIYLCGEDAHDCDAAGFTNLFLREYDSFKYEK
jgi:hypothetical protein